MLVDDRPVSVAVTGHQVTVSYIVEVSSPTEQPVIVGAQDVTVYDEVTSVVEVVHDCHAVKVSWTGTTVFEVTTVEVFFPTGQLVTSDAHEVTVYSSVFVIVDVDDCLAGLV